MIVIGVFEVKVNIFEVKVNMDKILFTGEMPDSVRSELIEEACHDCLELGDGTDISFAWEYPVNVNQMKITYDR